MLMLIGYSGLTLLHAQKVLKPESGRATKPGQNSGWAKLGLKRANAENVA
jgi:hypothetical protein